MNAQTKISDIRYDRTQAKNECNFYHKQYDSRGIKKMFTLHQV